MKFIKLTSALDDNTLYFNIDKIVHFRWANHINRTVLTTVTETDADAYFLIKETPEETFKLISEA